MTTVRTIGLWMMLALFGLTAAACDNTIRGVGRDAQDSGEAIEDAVN